MTTALIRRTIGLGVLAAIAGGVSGCGSTVREGRSPAYLIVQRIEAASGAEDDKFSDELSSDVLTNNSIFADPGQVTMELALKDPGSSTTPTKPTSMNFITVTRYRVEYIRADGRNTPGVDVPFPFSSGLTATVSGTQTVGFTLVRVQAKEEAPLRALRGGGGAFAISTIARITFFGHDQTGREVSVTGNLDVTFADWAG